MELLATFVGKLVLILILIVLIGVLVLKLNHLCEIFKV